MKRLVDFFKRLHVGQILSVLLASLLLLTSTACSTSDTRNARTDNLPVQVGGNNNPHKGGGDNSSNYKMSTDRRVTGNQRADLQLLSPQLIAATNLESDGENLLYPGSDTGSRSKSDIGTRGQAELAREVKQFPQQRQPVLDRSNPDAQILEKVGESFKDASAFIKDTAESASERPELQKNPAVGK